MYADKSNDGLNLTITSELHPAILVISPTTSSKDVALQMNQAMTICDKKCWYTQTTDLIVCEASDLTDLKQDSDTFEELSSGAHLFLQRNLDTNIGRLLLNICNQRRVNLLKPLKNFEDKGRFVIKI